MIKKFKKFLLKLKKDNKSLHQIEISNKYLSDNFYFNYSKNHLSEEGNDRLFSFANRLLDKEKRLENKKNDLWNEIISRGDHDDLMKYCLNKDIKNFYSLIDIAGKTNLTSGFSNYLKHLLQHGEILMEPSKQLWREVFNTNPPKIRNEVKEKDKIIGYLKESLSKIWPNSKLLNYKLDNLDQKKIKLLSKEKFNTINIS